MNLTVLIAVVTNWVNVATLTSNRIEVGLERTNAILVDSTGARVGLYQFTNVGRVWVRTNPPVTGVFPLQITASRLNASGVFQLSNSPVQLLIGRPPRTNPVAFEVRITPKAGLQTK